MGKGVTGKLERKAWQEERDREFVTEQA